MSPKEKKFLGIFLFFSLLLIILEKTNLISQPKKFLQKPIMMGEKLIFPINFWWNDFSSFFSSKRQLNQKIQKLEEELRRLSSEENQLAICQEENESMKKLLGAPLPPSWKFLPAKLVGEGGKLKIDKGEKDGVKKEMPVIWENILVGKIEEEGEDFSFLVTPKSLGVKIPVIVRRPNQRGIQAKGVLFSQGGEIILDRVLQSEDIKEGDLVVSNGDGWPTDILIGKISQVLPFSAEIYRQAKVNLLVDYSKLRTVFVVIKQ
ncbi:MAG: rod shape-determining protein MreC [Microgenomates group bacterium]